MARNLDRMITVITGASSGIGKALAMALSERGGRLLLTARRMDRLQSLNQSLGGQHLCVSADVSRPDDCRRIVESARDRFGRIDTLVCNAGYGLARAFDKMTEGDVRRIFDTNFFGTVECCRSAIPIMKRQEPRDGFRGQIVIVSSACARRGLPLFSTYAATKAAQLSLAEGLRVELKCDGIAVTSVHPVLCETDFFSTADEISGMSPAALAEGSKQSAAVVAAKMVKGIVKPAREIWPKAMSRLSLTIASALPAVVDPVMCKIRDKMLTEHAAKQGNQPADLEEIEEVSTPQHA